MKLDAFDALVAIGMLLAAIGIGLISIPAALIASGSALMVLGLVGAVAKGRGNNGKASKN